MRVGCAFVLSLIVSGAACADEPSPNAAIWTPPPSPIELDEQISNASLQRTTGAVLTVASALMSAGALAAGIVSIGNGGLPFDCHGECANAPLFYTGVGLGVTASVLGAVGIPLWAVGADRLGALRRHRARFALTTDARGGASAALHLTF